MPYKTKTPEQNRLSGQNNPEHIRTVPVATGEPEKPAFDDAAASLHWDRYVPALVALGVASAIDAPALQQLCEWWAVYLRASAQVREIKDFGTSAAKNCIANKATVQKNYNDLAKAFGMASLWRNAIDCKPQADNALNDYI